MAGGDNEVQRTMLEIVNQLDGFDSRGNIKVRSMSLPHHRHTSEVNCIRCSLDGYKRLHAFVWLHSNQTALMLDLALSGDCMIRRASFRRSCGLGHLDHGINSAQPSFAHLGGLH